jgi:hypothetical protein
MSPVFERLYSDRPIRVTILLFSRLLAGLLETPPKTAPHVTDVSKAANRLALCSFFSTNDFTMRHHCKPRSRESSLQFSALMRCGEIVAVALETSGRKNCVVTSPSLLIPENLEEEEKIAISTMVFRIITSRRPTIQLHTPLLEILHHTLPPLTHRPSGKLSRKRRIPCLISDQQMPWQQQRIILVIRAYFVHGHATRHTRG